MLSSSPSPVKVAADSSPETTHALAGKLYLSSSGWILLSVPNGLVRAVFDAIEEPGIELPPSKGGQLNAHISVIRPEELEQIGGPDRITERGHTFRYNLGPVKTVVPFGWDAMARVWFIEVNSPELRQLRKSYGLTPLPKNNEFQFHITVAVRRKKVLHDNADHSKAAAAIWQSRGSLPLWQRALHQRLQTPFAWRSNAGILDNMRDYVGGLTQNFRTLAEQEAGSGRLIAGLDPEYGWARLQQVLNQPGPQVVPPEIVNPVDRTLYQWMGQ